MTISDEDFIVDLQDNPDQDAGPTNTSRDGTVICAQMVFKSVTDPDSPANDGSFRPLKVLTREGSVFHAEEPCAIGFYFETEVRVYDLIWRCLAPYIPERLPAGHFGSICGTFIGGTHPDTGRQYTIIEPQIGGWGAWDGRDGNPCIFSGFHGETYNTPAEISEARNGLFVDRMALNTDPGGEGEVLRWSRIGFGIPDPRRNRLSDGWIHTLQGQAVAAWRRARRVGQLRRSGQGGWSHRALQLCIRPFPDHR